MSINNGLPNNPQINYFSIQPSDVAQLNEERRLFEEGLLREGVGLIDVQFFPPSPDNLIGEKIFQFKENIRISMLKSKVKSTE